MLSVPQIFLSLTLIGLLGFFLPIPIQAEEADLSAEEIVKECELKTGFKATDRAARGFIFRRCIQTIQFEKGERKIAESTALHRGRLQTRANASFTRRGTGDRGLLRNLRTPRSKGVQRVYTDPQRFESIQFNRARSPDVPDSPKEAKMQRAKVDVANDRYQMTQLSEACGNLTGLRKDICLRAQLQGGSPRRWTKPSRQR